MHPQARAGIARRAITLGMLAGALCAPGIAARAAEGGAAVVYENTLKPVPRPAPILADHPRFVAPVKEGRRFRAPALIVDQSPTLEVMAWRWSYNARGIIEVPNRLDGKATAIVIVHPWGIGDGQGWRTPEPAGAAFQCTPEKNAITLEHSKVVIRPFIDRLRGRLAVVGYSLPATEDPIRAKLYPSVHTPAAKLDRKTGRAELRKALEAFSYRAGALPSRITLSREHPTAGYFAQLPGLDAGDHYDGPGYWELPVPVMSTLEVRDEDVVFYDKHGYPELRDYLKKRGVRHVLLGGYCTDMCVISTTAGYENLQKDFDVFLVGDATLATFPAAARPDHATNAALCLASLNLLITQASWVKPM